MHTLNTVKGLFKDGNDRQAKDFYEKYIRSASLDQKEEYYAGIYDNYFKIDELENAEQMTEMDGELVNAWKKDLKKQIKTLKDEEYVNDELID